VSYILSKNELSLILRTNLDSLSFEELKSRRIVLGKEIDKDIKLLPNKKLLLNRKLSIWRQKRNLKYFSENSTYHLLLG